MESNTKNNIFLPMFLIAALTFFAYSFMLSNSFKTMDDDSSIIRNQNVHDLHHLPEIFTSAYFTEEAYYRPLPMLSYAVEYHFFKLNAFYYYLTNIGLHVITAWLVLALLLTLIPARLAFAAALLFAIHPIHWEAVSNISGRAILLCALFEVLSIWLFVLATQRGNRLFYAGSLVAFLLALLSKESAGMLPIILAAYQIFVSTKKNDRFQEKVLSLVPFFALEVIYIWFRFNLGITKVYHWRSFPEMMLGFFTFLRGLLTYIRMMIVPADLHFDRSQALFFSFTNGELWITLLVFSVIIFAFWHWRQRLSGLTKFFLAWALIDLLPVAQIVASIGVQPGRISLAEHFLYTSSIGVLVVLVMTAVEWWEKKRGTLAPMVGTIVVAAIYGFLFLATIQNNIYASNEIAMFERSLQFSPQNTRIRNSLALAYAKVHQYNHAENNFRQVLEVEPYDVRARIGLGKSLIDQGKLWQGLLEYEKVSDPGSMKKIFEGNLQAVYQLLLKKYTAEIENGSQKARAYFSRGVIYSKMGQVQLAIQDYEQGLTLGPMQEDTLFNLATSYEVLENWPQAALYYEKVLDLDDTRGELDKYAYQHLAQIYERLGEKERLQKYSPPDQGIKN